MAFAYCFRSGEIEVGIRVPKGAITVATGRRQHLTDAIEARARLAYDNTTWLVPGLPEASDDDAAVSAMRSFAKWLCRGRPIVPNPALQEEAA